MSETNIIKLIPCDYDSSYEEENILNQTQNSIESSDLVDCSDDDDEKESIVVTEINKKTNTTVLDEDHTDFKKIKLLRYAPVSTDNKFILS